MNISRSVGRRAITGSRRFRFILSPAWCAGRFCREGHSRHLAVTLVDGPGPAAGLTIHNFYVPAGGDEPNPEVNPKFSHKLDFVERMSRGPDEGHLAPERAVIVGDLNIAPLETDVWSHKALLKVVSHTPVEVEAFGRILSAGAWVDAMRDRISPREKTLHVVELPLTPTGFAPTRAVGSTLCC